MRNISNFSPQINLTNVILGVYQSHDKSFTKRLSRLTESAQLHACILTALVKKNVQSKRLNLKLCIWPKNTESQQFHIAWLSETKE